MKALALEHLHSNPLGVYGDVLADRGVDVDRVLLDRGQPLRDWRAYDFLVVMGGGMSAYDDQVYPWLVDEKRTIREAVLAGVPFFGVCLGAQLLASALGARVYRGPAPELGVIPLSLSEAARRDPVFRGLPSDLEVFQWHCDTFALPDGATRLAGSPRYENQAFRYGDVAYAIQCHLETTVEDVQDWFAAWPSLGETFEERYGQGALAAFLDEYAASVPHLRATARQVFRRWLESALANGRRASKQSDEQSLERSGNGLIGRARERALLHALVADARDGRGGALTIAAAGGAGKTALLNVVEREVTGMRVLRAAGVATVAERPLAGIDALCRPLLDLLPELAEGESAALAAALELGGDDGSPDDRFAVYAGAASLLRAGARRQPLLVLVDDVHLLDEPSREAVEFIASQVDGSSIAIVMATEDRPRSGSAVLELPPLDRPAALTLLDRRSDSIANTVLGEIVDAAAGNPLALLEIANGVTMAQRSGAEPAEDVPAVCASAEQAFLARISALPPEARQALVVVALGNGEPGTVVGSALAELGFDERTLEPAVVAGLVEPSVSGVVFLHELARATVAYSALRSERRAAHGALAKHARGADERAWHAARAVSAPDEDAALDLEDAGRRAAARGAFATAARAFELAARITPEPAERSRRLVAAAEASDRAGHTAAAIDHLEEALAHLPASESRADAELLLGRVLARSGSASRARAILLDAADSGSQYAQATICRLLTEAVIPTLRAGDPLSAIATGRRALALATPETPEELSASVMLGTAFVRGGELEEARRLVLHARMLASSGLRPPPGLLAYLGAALRLVGEREAARQELVDAIERARTRGSLSMLAYALVRLADVELDDGNWSTAAPALDEAVSLARETGQASDLGLAISGLAWLAAAQGREDPCRRHAAQALDLADRLGAGSRVDRALLALGLLELGRGDHSAAAAHLTELRAQQRAQGWCDAAVQPHRVPDLVEALHFAGNSTAAIEELAVFEAEARQVGRASAIAAAARCRGLVGPDDEIDHWFTIALDAPVSVSGPFELARTHLGYAERLISTGRSDRGAPHLSAARGIFDELGANPWQRRVQLALGRS